MPRMLRRSSTSGAMIFNNMGIMIPWLSKLINEDRRVLGDDWWPYGVEANRKAVDAFCVTISNRVSRSGD